jgi:hypothetical protein
MGSALFHMFNDNHYVEGALRGEYPLNVIPERFFSDREWVASVMNQYPLRSASLFSFADASLREDREWVSGLITKKSSQMDVGGFVFFSDLGENLKCDKLFMLTWIEHMGIQSYELLCEDLRKDTDILNACIAHPPGHIQTGRELVQYISPQVLKKYPHLLSANTKLCRAALGQGHISLKEAPSQFQKDVGCAIAAIDHNHRQIGDVPPEVFQSLEFQKRLMNLIVDAHRYNFRWIERVRADKVWFEKWHAERDRSEQSSAIQHFWTSCQDPKKTSSQRLLT